LKVAFGVVFFLLVEGEIDFAGFQTVRDLDQDSGNKSQKGFLIREENYDASAFLDLAVHIFAGIGGGQAFLVFVRVGKYG
jgi:hypothetical protein